MIDKRKESLFFFCPRKEQRDLRSPWQGGDTHQRSPSITDSKSSTHPTAGGIAEVHVGMCALMRPSSRS